MAKKPNHFTNSMEPFAVGDNSETMRLFVEMRKKTNPNSRRETIAKKLARQELKKGHDDLILHWAAYGIELIVFQIERNATRRAEARALEESEQRGWEDDVFTPEQQKRMRANDILDARYERLKAIWGDLLDEEVALGDGTKKKWGDMTVVDHRQRITMLEKMRDGINRTISLHELAIEELEGSEMPCLNRVLEIAA